MAFYTKHIPEDQEILAIFRTHWITVLDSFILWISFGAIIPAFLYHQSERIQEMLPFFVLEGFLLFIFCKIVYELFNWYNDIWIITENAIYDIEWSLLKTHVESVHFESIEGVEMEKDRIWDSIFNKGNIILHKYGEEELAIYNVYNPYESVEVMESILGEKEDHHEDEGDKFDMIMDTLSGVVKDFLERKGLPESSHTHRHHGEEDEQGAEYEAHEHSFHEHEEKSEKKDEYTLDLR